MLSQLTELIKWFLGNLHNIINIHHIHKHIYVCTYVFLNQIYEKTSYRMFTSKRKSIIFEL